MKKAVLAFCKKENCETNLLENLLFQNLLKIRKFSPVEKFGNILAFDKESKRKLLSLILADSFFKNIIYTYKWKIF